MTATNIKRDIGGHTVLEQLGAVVVDEQLFAAQADQAMEAQVALSHGAKDWYPESWLPEVAKRAER